MSNKPKKITLEETCEIAAMIDVQEMWGAENHFEMADILEDSVYAVKFNFHSGGPGYVGDLYLLQGDVLGEPVTLIRGVDQKLSIV